LHWEVRNTPKASTFNIFNDQVKIYIYTSNTYPKSST
jgi:hypothetical protein